MVADFLPPDLATARVDFTDVFREVDFTFDLDATDPVGVGRLVVVLDGDFRRFFTAIGNLLRTKHHPLEKGDQMHPPQSHSLIPTAA